MKEPIAITGLWLRRSGDYAVVCVEVGGKWVEAIVEHVDGTFSHIAEPRGIEARRSMAHKHKGAE